MSTGSDSVKPANEVITGFLPEARLLEQGGKRPAGASEAYRELIELELSLFISVRPESFWSR